MVVLNLVTTRFVKLTASAKMPDRKHGGDAGFDLYTSEEVTIAPKEWADVHTGIAIELPSQCWAMITGRSSAFRKRGLQVQTGIIDSGYRGELFMAVWNPGEHYLTIKVGERVAQLIPFNLVPLVFEETEQLSDSSRGSEGFGSTGQ